jgi:hypothetical protein
VASERVYSCLECGGTYIGKALAYLHVRDQHASLLDDHHIDEFLVSRQGAVEVVEEDNFSPPFCCQYCEITAITPMGIGNHLAAAHGLPRDGQVYMRDYISSLDKIAEESREKASNEREFEHACLVLDSICGLTDFLTECGDEAPAE